MEHAQNQLRSRPLEAVDEALLGSFAQRLVGVTYPADLFDDGLGGVGRGDTPPRPTMPPEQARALIHREYFAPVIALHPQVVDPGSVPRTLEPVS